MLDLSPRGFGVVLELQMNVFDEAIRLTEEVPSRIELPCGNGNGRQADETVSDVLLLTQPRGGFERSTKPRACLVEAPVAQFCEPEIAQAVGHLLLQAVLLCDG